jgi:hypothetical protein
MSPEEPNAEKLQDETKDSIEKARDLLEEFKIIQEHERRIFEDQYGKFNSRSDARKTYN